MFMLRGPVIFIPSFFELETMKKASKSADPRRY
jgi:hypothetical protein